MKHKKIENLIFKIVLLFLISTTTIYAQSIGVTPEKTMEVKTNTPAVAYFGVSQGSDYAEQVTIEGDYSWLEIPEKSFILESKQGKSIKVNINIKKPGRYTANLKVCGSPVTAEGAVLSTKACTSNKLTVTATLDDKTKTKYTIAAIAFFTLVICFFAYFFKKYLFKKIKPKKQLKK